MKKVREQIRALRAMGMDDKAIVAQICNRPSLDEYREILTAEPTAANSARGIANVIQHEVNALNLNGVANDG